MTGRRLTRVLVAVLAGLCCGALPVWVAVGDGPDVRLGVAPPPAHDAVAVEEGEPREVLRAWDAARAAAWLDGDVDTLASLYVAGSAAGARDVAMLRKWNQRGQHVTRLTTQVLRLDVVHEGRSRLVLVVTDRLARVEAGGVVLPRDQPSTRRIELRRGSGGHWRVHTVVEELRPRGEGGASKPGEPP